MPRSYIAVEPRVRRLVAAHLGVDPGALQPDTDLRLGPDARSDVARTLERTFSITIDDPELARLRSCRQLSQLVARRVAARDSPGERALAPVWVRIPPADPHCPPLERLVELTPYMVQTIVEDARAPRRSRRLEVILGPTPPAAVATQVEQLLAAARAAGLSVHVHRGARPPATPPPARGRKRGS